MIQDKKAFLTKVLQHFGVVLFFLLATVIYFSPEFFDNKTLPQHDVTQFQGSSQDIREYYNNEGESSAWTGGMFSGMPAYQIGIWGGSPNILDYVEAPLKALGNTTAGPVFAGMLMAYILFLILGFSIPMAMFGAIAYSLSSYNFIILDAGHVTKAWALAYMPIVVAGLLAMYKNKYIVGGLCMALGLALQIKSNHLQITYYTAILCAILYIGLAIKQIKDKEISSLIKSSGILLIAVTLALLANAASIYSNYEMSKTSTRGKSELTAQSGEGNKADGLDKDYVFGWSYGKAETLSLLVPNIHGGSSVPFDEKSNTYQTLISMVQNQQIDEQNANVLIQYARQYWGDQPLTSGPVYFGAIICMLFLLGIIIIRSPIKWVLLGATLFFVFLSWGKNFDVFNDIFYNYFPLYAKFRAVSQALVIPALLMVIIAVWTIKEFFEGNIEKERLTKALYIAAGITGGLCLILWLAPNTFFNFVSANDVWKDQVPRAFLDAVVSDRKAMLSADALRSLIFILLAGATLWFTINKSKMKDIAVYATAVLILLTLVDLWGVDKRFLNDAKFVSKREKQATFIKKLADDAILQDKDLSYRVFTMNNPFGETGTSYYHKSIGGYHAAKLQRYQQLIEHRLQPELASIGSSFQTQNIDSIVASFEGNVGLNMLNTRYIVFDPNQQPLVNPHAMGNAWFVSDYEFVENADAEIASLNTLDAKSTAVIDRRFEENLNGFSIKTDSMASIKLVGYKPNMLTYRSNANSNQLTVFSEIYYPDGWNAYVDGQLTPHFRADWTLRAMIVPAGEHEIVFKFEPSAYNVGRTLATGSSTLLVLLLIGTVIWQFTRKEENIKRKE